MAKSNAPTVIRKPRADFPLFPHATGRWAKKVRGKLCYFGKTADDPAGAKALELWAEQKDDLLLGRKPRAKAADGVTLADVINGFLDYKQQQRDSGELAPRTWDGYKEVGVMLAAQLGRDRLASDLRPDDFAELRASMAKRWGPVALGNRIQVVRSIFRWGFESELLADPVRFGPAFKKPSAKTLREAKQAKGPRMYSPEQITALLAAATPNMRAMILLAINGGLGNADLGALTTDDLDLEGGWLNQPREKTAVARRIPLWRETIEAIQLVLKVRPMHRNPDDAELIFIGPRGKAYHRGWRISAEFKATASRAKLPTILGEFYSLRRTFQTVAENCGDFPAVSSIMGHAPRSGDMAAIYRQRISDERLRAVVTAVHSWLWPAVATA